MARPVPMLFCQTIRTPLGGDRLRGGAVEGCEWGFRCVSMLTASTGLRAERAVAPQRIASPKA